MHATFIPQDGLQEAFRIQQGLDLKRVSEELLLSKFTARKQLEVSIDAAIACNTKKNMI
jgi:hypothetical protein